MHKKCYQAKRCLLFFCLFTIKGFGQFDSIRQGLIETLSKDINESYVDKKFAKQMIDSIRLKYKLGGYNNTINLDEFTFEITKDIRRIGNDNHLKVTPSHRIDLDSSERSNEYKRISDKEYKKRVKKNEKNIRRMLEIEKEDMFTYGDIKVLSNKIGYVEIRNFHSVSFVKSENKDRITIKSLFKFLRNCNSIIIDLRENGGGSVNLAAKFSSYFSQNPNSYFITSKDFFRYDSSGIEKEVISIKRYSTDMEITSALTKSKDIYILTSKRTFSAAELVIYKIKQLVSSAKVIGEQTLGGGNGISYYQLHPFYIASIPNCLFFDESNNDYQIQNRGVTPDIFSSSDSALQIAYKLAGKSNLETLEQDVKYLRKAKVAEVNPCLENCYEDYLGDYRKITIYVNNGYLFMLYDTFAKCLLIPATQDLFETDDFEFIQFVRNSDGKVAEIHVKNKDGYIEKFRKQ